jgi:simple sugar transport system ATP-binding protein
VLDRVSLTLRAGSLIGVAGVDGNGQDELVEVVAGVRSATCGSVRLLGHAGPSADLLAVIPQNRDANGLILELSLWENLLLARALRRPMATRYGWIRRPRAIQLCQELLDRFSVRAAGPHALAGSLSGGNRQRLVVARAMAAAPVAIVAHDMTRGLDLGAAAELRWRLRDYAARGGAVLLISSDLDELRSLCEQLYVINRGRLSEVQGGGKDPVEIGLLMSGGARGPALFEQIYRNAEHERQRADPPDKK